MADKDTDLTFKDCSEYILCRFGDEVYSYCKLTGQYCLADEPNAKCSMWEEEKAELLTESHEVSEQGSSSL